MLKFLSTRYRKIFPNYSLSLDNRTGKAIKMLNTCSFALKTFGLLDPHGICVKQIALLPDLYWSIIWYYGSVYAALQEVGRSPLCHFDIFSFRIEIIGAMFWSWRLSLIFGGQEF